MSKPAARMGDTTVHGGTIVKGEPTVLIGGMPAARVGDMHVCPMLNPGVPPPPHVGGPILMGSFVVLIGGAPAARAGDMCQCSGPPDSIAMGCPTVLIGESGGGGGGGTPGTGSSKAGEGSEGKEGDETEGHYLDVKFVDKGGKPITGVGYTVKSPDNKTDHGTVFGKVKKTGVAAGSHEIALKAITKACWSAPTARDGEKVKLKVETAGIDPAAMASFQVWERSINTADKQITVIENIQLSGGKAEPEWQYVYVDEDDAAPQAGKPPKPKYFSPTYYFTVAIDNQQARSPILGYKDYVELYLKDGDDQPIANARYRVFLSSGEVREGQLDGNGYKKIEKVPPGKWSVQFPDHAAPDES
ncbi:MAG TPA: PAAR domain-containing protein [Candidatus Deferrimicrobium sp.]|nr:PAAR domain-containing protein [Candidatus Deferrimicrobium sp.]